MPDAGEQVDPYADAQPETTDADVDVSQIWEGQEETLYERLGGAYGIAGAVDVLTDRLFENDTANQNPVTREFHENYDSAGFKYLVTAWAIQYSGGPEVYPGRGDGRGPRGSRGVGTGVRRGPHGDQGHVVPRGRPRTGDQGVHGHHRHVP